MGQGDPTKVVSSFNKGLHLGCRGIVGRILPRHAWGTDEDGISPDRGSSGRSRAVEIFGSSIVACHRICQYLAHVTFTNVQQLPFVFPFLNILSFRLCIRISFINYSVFVSKTGTETSRCASLTRRCTHVLHCEKEDACSNL
jgi:hypothetical protein